MNLFKFRVLTGIEVSGDYYEKVIAPLFNSTESHSELLQLIDKEELKKHKLEFKDIGDILNNSIVIIDDRSLGNYKVHYPISQDDFEIISRSNECNYIKLKIDGGKIVRR